MLTIIGVTLFVLFCIFCSKDQKKAEKAREQAVHDNPGRNLNRGWKEQQSSFDEVYRQSDITDYSRGI